MLAGFVADCLLPHGLLLVVQISSRSIFRLNVARTRLAVEVAALLDRTAAVTRGYTRRVEDVAIV